MINLEDILANALGEQKPKNKTKYNNDIEQIVAGKFIAENLYCVTKKYKFGDLIGKYKLENFDLHYGITKWANLSKNPAEDDYLFIDTETTGLSGGTGTYAFLVGIGYFIPTGFRIEQFFMNDLSAEFAMLETLKTKMSSDKTLVSYNGKSFDINLLETRFIANGIQFSPKKLNHIDLLHLVRRFWKGSFSSCSLQSIEKFVLRSFRNIEDEIPGAQIPQLYFDYLDSANCGKLENIFFHNQSDIVSLAVILKLISEILQEKEDWFKLMVNPLGLAKFYSEFISIEKAIEILKKNTVEADCRKYLSFIYKQQENWQKSIELWKLAADDRELFAFEELAKYYEHHANNLALAQKYTLHALEIITGGYWVDPQKLSDFSHRLERLEQKIHNEK